MSFVCYAFILQTTDECKWSLFRSRHVKIPSHFLVRDLTIITQLKLIQATLESIFMHIREWFITVDVLTEYIC
jgi:hypothetical protein